METIFYYVDEHGGLHGSPNPYLRDEIAVNKKIDPEDIGFCSRKQFEKDEGQMLQGWML